MGAAASSTELKALNPESRKRYSNHFKKLLSEGIGEREAKNILASRLAIENEISTRQFQRKSSNGSSSKRLLESDKNRPNSHNDIVSSPSNISAENFLVSDQMEIEPPKITVLARRKSLTDVTAATITTPTSRHANEPR